MNSRVYTRVTPSRPSLTLKVLGRPFLLLPSQALEADRAACPVLPLPPHFVPISLMPFTHPDSSVCLQNCPDPPILSSGQGLHVLNYRALNAPALSKPPATPKKQISSTRESPFTKSCLSEVPQDTKGKWPVSRVTTPNLKLKFQKQNTPTLENPTQKPHPTPLVTLWSRIEVFPPIIKPQLHITQAQNQL